MSPSVKFTRLKEPRAGSEASDVRVSTFNDQQLPLLYEAAATVDLPEWVRLNHTVLRQKLYQHGALLLRSASKPDFAATVRAFTKSLVDYRGGAAIRSRVDRDTYTASEYPSDLEIRLHSEFCYSNDWPMILFFHCSEISPGQGGQTPIANNRRILADMPEDVRRQFADRGLTYMRGYGFNRTWQRSYETDSRDEVEALCNAEGRRCEWIGDNQLRSYETRPAVATHPVTNDDVWFNYAHGFHISRMDDGIREALSTSVDDTDEQLWPNNVFWGDGTPIDPAIIEIANDVVHRNAVQFDWQVGDTLVVDNMLCAHGRRPYKGTRRILLQMAESFQATRTGSLLVRNV
jgi:alpha-ketoglutarate-dependent taurine dioxygenase